jgi:hypothetical protein
VIKGSHATAHYPQVSGDGDLRQPTDDRVVHDSQRDGRPTPAPTEHGDRRGEQGDQGKQPAHAALAHIARQRRRLSRRPASSPPGREPDGWLLTMPRSRCILAGGQFHDVHLTSGLLRTVPLVGSLAGRDQAIRLVERRS